MIKIANLIIIDTGYLSITTSSGTQATMANSGNTINLKTSSISYTGDRNVDDSPIINSNSESSLNTGSINNAKIIVQGVMKRDNTSDMDLLKEMNLLRKTFGIKLLYSSSTTDGYREITDSIGSTDSTHLSGTTPHIHIRVLNFSVKQIADTKLLRYTLELQETG